MTKELEFIKVVAALREWLDKRGLHEGPIELVVNYPSQGAAACADFLYQQDFMPFRKPTIEPSASDPNIISKVMDIRVKFGVTK
jgi:hypothetical protein